MNTRDQKVQEILQRDHALRQHCLVLRRENHMRHKGRCSCVLAASCFADHDSFVPAMCSVGDETAETHRIDHYGWRES